MKRRILAVTLALCLCISTQSVVYAGQGDVLLQTVDSQEDSGGGDTALREEPEQSENDGGTTGQENPEQPEGSESMNTPQPDGTANQPGSSDVPGTESPDSQPEGSDGTETKTPDSQPESSDGTGTETPDSQPEGSDGTETESPDSQPEDCDGTETESPDSQPEGSDGTETESPDSQPEDSGDVNTIPQDPPAQTENNGNVDTAPEETPTQPEDIDLEENTEESDAALMEISLLLDAAPVGRALYEPPIPDVTYPVPTEVYNAMIALKTQEGYTQGSEWTDYYPYSDEAGLYRWHGGQLDGHNVAAVGCSAFAFILSDAAFGKLPARIYERGSFSYEDIKVGDILRVNNNSHTVIVLQVSDAGVVIAEGNYNKSVNWGRGIDRETLMSETSRYITRYPENYIPPTDPGADESIGSGPFGELNWNLTKIGTLTISGNGAMPDFSSANEQPWYAKKDQIRKVVIKDGITNIGACAFWDCGVLSVEIPSSVKTIGSYAFHKSSLLSVTIPSSVKTIGSSAFGYCANLNSVTISEGVETIEQNAFQACTSLTSVSLPASIVELGASAFFDCEKMTKVTFASGSRQVKMGDDVFGRCWELTGVKLPQNINCISKGMFQNCLLLSNVEIPQGVESIEESGFASCSRLTSVVIPDSVKTIGRSAFASCASLKEIYFTGTEAQWSNINIVGDTAQVLSKITIHYNYIPVTPPDPDEGGEEQPGTPPGEDKPDDSKPGENQPGDNKPGENQPGDNKPGENQPGDDKPGENQPGDNKPGENEPGENRPGENKPDENRPGESNSGEDSQNIKADANTWKPTTPDEIKRYSYVGKEPVRCTLPEGTAYPVEVENAVQGPMCIQVFETVCGDYTIARTYNIYALSDTTYTTDQKVRITIEIPSVVYKKGREYKMICVTEGGKPVLFDDLDNDPNTITIETDTFYAYALIYK